MSDSRFRSNGRNFDKTFENFDLDFEKATKRTFGLMLFAWVLTVLISLGVAVAVIWGIVQLVQHYT